MVVVAHTRQEGVHLRDVLVHPVLCLCVALGVAVMTASASASSSAPTAPLVRSAPAQMPSAANLAWHFADGSVVVNRYSELASAEGLPEEFPVGHLAVRYPEADADAASGKAIVLFDGHDLDV